MQRKVEIQFFSKLATLHMQILSAGPTAAASLSRRWLINVRQTGSSLEKAAAAAEEGVGGGRRAFRSQNCVGFFSLCKVK